MPTRTLVSLWSIAIGWAFFWTVLHLSRPGAFPWVGVPVGFLVVAPLLLLNWLEQRKTRERSKHGQQALKPDDGGHS